MAVSVSTARNAAGCRPGPIGNASVVYWAERQEPSVRINNCGRWPHAVGTVALTGDTACIATKWGYFQGLLSRRCTTCEKWNSSDLIRKWGQEFRSAFGNFIGAKETRLFFTSRMEGGYQKSTLDWLWARFKGWPRHLLRSGVRIWH